MTRGAGNDAGCLPMIAMAVLGWSAALCLAAWVLR